MRPTPSMWAMSVAGLFACSPTRTLVPDGGQEDAARGYCGDGVVSSDPLHYEECDDGPATGTENSYCSAECILFGTPPFVARYVTLPFVSESHAPLNFNGLVEGLAFTAYDDKGLHVIRELRPEHFAGAPPESIDISQSGRVVALSNIGVRGGGPAVYSVLPVWIEKDSDGALRLYYADISPSLAVTVREIPYPFADGGTPKLVASRARVSTLLIDKATTTEELLVALILVRGVNDIYVKTLRLPPGGSQLGGTAETTELDLVINKPFVQQVVQFFPDTKTFVSVINEQPPVSDMWADAGDYTLYEAARGHWPHDVVGAAPWLEGWCPVAPMTKPAFTHPAPIATLTPEGAIYVSQFTPQAADEGFLEPIAQIEPGTSALAPSIIHGTTLRGVWAYEPSGTIVMLKDSNCEDLRSKALLPRRLAGMPWTQRSTATPHHSTATLTTDDRFVTDQ